MEGELLTTLGQVAGIGGVSLGVVLFVFRDIIKKNIFPKFRDEKLGFRLLRYMVFAVWSLAVLGIGAWVFGVRSGEAATVSVHNDIVGGDMQLTSVGAIVNHYGSDLDPAIVQDIERALALAAHGRATQAIPIMENVARQVRSPALLSDLGSMYAMEGDVDGALASFGEAIELEPDFGPARHNLQTLSSWREEAVRVGGIESEPNDALLEPNRIRLAKVAVGRLDDSEDIDSYVFTTPEGPRDWYSIEVRNLSAELSPRLAVYGSDKALVASTSPFSTEVTPGQDQTVRIVMPGGSAAYAQVLSVGGDGAYRVVARPEGAFDEFEPNDGILQAAAVSGSSAVEANIMDESDADYYSVERHAPGEQRVTVENLSAQLRPRLLVYGPDKALVASTSFLSSEVTPGQDVSATVAIPLDGPYFVEVRAISGRGSYRLKIESG